MPEPAAARETAAPRAPAPGGGRPLPAGWRWVRLGEVCSIVARQVDPKLPEYGALPHVSGEDIEGGRGRIGPLKTAAEDGMTSGKYLFEAGDVLYSKLRPYLRKAAVASCQGVCSADMYPIRADASQLDSTYLAWLFISDDFTAYADSESRRARMPKLNREQLFAWETPLPPLPEQKRIAAVLAEQMAAVDRARAAAEARLEAARALPAAYLRAVFESPEARGWPRRRLGDVGDVVNGFGFAEHLQGRHDLPYPFVKVSDMNADGAESVVRMAANTVDDQMLKTLRARTYPAGTVIFPKVGGALLTNKKRVLGTEATFDNNVMGIVPKSVDSSWLFRWMQTVDLRTLANTQALPSIRQSEVAELEVPLPDRGEQERALGLLTERLEGAACAQQAAEAELAAINALPAALLRRAFSGEL